MKTIYVVLSFVLVLVTVIGALYVIREKERRGELASIVDVKLTENLPNTAKESKTNKFFSWNNGFIRSISLMGAITLADILIISLYCFIFMWNGDYYYLDEFKVIIIWSIILGIVFAFFELFSIFILDAGLSMSRWYIFLGCGIGIPILFGILAYFVAYAFGKGWH